MPRYELHAHTAECDTAAHIGAAELVRIYQAAGYDGMVITDHYFSHFYQWFAAELVGADHRTVMQRRLKGYYTARNEGEKLGFTVLPGAEVRFDGTINDYLVYGCDEEFFCTAPRLNELKSIHELLAILPPEACVVHAHPFRNRMTVIDPTPLFGIEVHNGLTEPFRNELAALYATHYGKAMTSGSDCHHRDHAARGGIETPCPIRTPRELTDVLRSGSYTLYRGG